MSQDVPRFDRQFFDGHERFTAIGEGSIGGKASGLLRLRDVLAARVDAARHPGVEVSIPALTVLTTDLFDRFLDENGLRDLAHSGASDERIALAFQRAALPVEITGDLRALIRGVTQPLAIRSSSLLEDALYQPFAGVYATKMIPNNQPHVDARFRRLVESIKLVWASTFFREARRYAAAAGRSIEEEKMAVIVQEVVGRRHRERFYPDLSGVARSYNFYRSGNARPEDGVVSLALGLGRTIVDDGVAWSYSPAHPRVAPPHGSVGELLERTQTQFWAVNMGEPPAYNPIVETEYLTRCGLADSEEDGTIRYAASTYDAGSDRLVAGTGRQGPRVLNFAPLLDLEEWPVNAIVRDLLRICEEETGGVVEIELAATFEEAPARKARIGFLQVRPMVVSQERVEIAAEESASERVLVASEAVMGNGVVDDVRDVVYVRPDRFEGRHTPRIADEIATLNDALAAEGRPYLLIGFGRWGSTDSWLGIPVVWAQISGARAIVEASLATMNVDLSQGSHFFHNISSFRIPYFCVRHDTGRPIRWDVLDHRPAIAETPFVRHVRFERPLLVKVDGRAGRGVVLAPPAG